MKYKTKIKICGLKEEEDILAVNDLPVDYVGFVFAHSKRMISEEKAEELRSKLHPSIRTVGVFVNEDIDRIVRLCKKKTIHLVQLHGDEDTAYISELKKKIHVPVIKAVRVRSVGDILKAEGMDTEYLLLDSYHQKEYGGSGISFDWSIIPTIRKPYFLAGGLNAENVLQAISRFEPYAVDVSSGVETDGKKDRDKIHKFVSKIRSVR